MAERGQCLKCASPGAELEVCLDCGQIRRGQFSAREIVRGSDGRHYVKVCIAGLIAVDPPVPQWWEEDTICLELDLKPRRQCD